MMTEEVERTMRVKIGIEGLRMQREGIEEGDRRETGERRDRRGRTKGL